jgi:hypothetical protein
LRMPYLRAHPSRIRPVAGVARASGFGTYRGDQRRRSQGGCKMSDEAKVKPEHERRSRSLHRHGRRVRVASVVCPRCDGRRGYTAARIINATGDWETYIQRCQDCGGTGRLRINTPTVRMSDPEPSADASKVANPKDSLDAPVGLSEGLENNPPRQRPNLMKTTTIEIKGRLTKAQCDTISAAAGWIERICNRKDELPKLFMDNTDPAPIAKKLRAMVKGVEAPNNPARRALTL